MKRLFIFTSIFAAGCSGADLGGADVHDVGHADSGRFGDAGELDDSGNPDTGELDADVLDQGDFDAATVDSADVGPGDTGAPLAIDRVAWVLPQRVWSGSPLTIELTLLAADGTPVNAAGAVVTLEVASGTSTGVISGGTDLGAGVHQFNFRGLMEGTALRFDVLVDGMALGMLSQELQVIVPLLHYAPAGATQTISQIGNNLSGHVWNPDTEEFLLIRNDDRRLHVLSPYLSHLSEVTLSSSPIGTDLEDIVYLGGPASAPEYAMLNEAGGAIIGVIPPNISGTLNLASWQRIQYAARPPVGNKGGEGIAYDPATMRMWACTERSPMSIHEFVRPAPGADVSYLNGFTVTIPFDAQATLGSTITDISSCLFDPRTQRLLILSHESSRLLDVDWDGTVIATLDVNGANQFEGVALIAGQDMLLSSEPNQIRSYTYNGPMP